MMTYSPKAIKCDPAWKGKRKEMLEGRRRSGASRGGFQRESYSDKKTGGFSSKKRPAFIPQK